MHELKRKASSTTQITIAAMVPFALYQLRNDVLFTYLAIAGAALLTYAAWSWWKTGRQAAAWIKDGALYIYAGSSEPHVLHEDEIVGIQYSVKNRKEHLITATLQDGSVRQIPIHNVQEHITGQRLLKFIDEHFQPVSLESF